MKRGCIYTDMLGVLLAALFGGGGLWALVQKLLVGVALPSLLLLSCVASPGCAFIRPTTEFTGPGGWSVRDSKDNDIVIDGLNASKTAEGGTLAATKITIANKSSPVITANVQQMLAFVEQQKAANEGIKATLSGLALVIDELTNILNPPAGWIDRIAAINLQIQGTKDLIAIQMGQLNNMQTALEKQIPATQPVKETP